MAAPFFEARPVRRNYDGAKHAIQEFSAGVAFMIESGDGAKVDIGSLVENLVLALKGQTQKPAVHPLLYVNLAFVLGLAFACGSLWQDVATIKEKTQAVDLVQVVNTKIDRLTTEFDNFRNSMERQEKTR
jgi:hypothetical protein